MHQLQIANRTSATRQHVAPTNYYFHSRLKDPPRAIPKIVFLEKSSNKYLQSIYRQENEPKAEKGEARRSNRTKQNNKRADRKVEYQMTALRFQTGETSEAPGLPSVHQRYGFIICWVDRLCRSWISSRNAKRSCHGRKNPAKYTREQKKKKKKNNPARAATASLLSSKKLKITIITIITISICHRQLHQSSASSIACAASVCNNILSCKQLRHKQF